MGSHQAIIRLLGSIISCAILCSVWAASNYHRRYENMQRSPRHPWYRDTDESIAEFDCSYFKGQLQRGSFFNLHSEYGYLCLKIQANIRVITWCKSGESPEKYLFVNATVLSTRASSIFKYCEIYEVTLIGKYGMYPDFNYYKIIHIDGVLWCVDMDSMINGDESLFYIPELFENEWGPSVRYTLCANSMEPYCSRPLLVQSLQPREVLIELGGCAGNSDSC